MRTRRYFLPFLVVVLLGLLTLRSLVQMGAETGFSDPLQGQKLPFFTLQTLEGKSAQFGTVDLQGKLAILNIFASWCGACRMEHATLKAFAEREKIPVYGVAYNDKTADTKLYLARMGNMYEKVGEDPQGTLGIALGMKGVPETYLIAPDGTLVAMYRGALSPDALNTYFLPKIQAIRTSKPL